MSRKIVHLIAFATISSCCVAFAAADPVLPDFVQPTGFKIKNPLSTEPLIESKGDGYVGINLPYVFEWKSMLSGQNELSKFCKFTLLSGLLDLNYAEISDPSELTDMKVGNMTVKMFGMTVYQRPKVPGSTTPWQQMNANAQFQRATQNLNQATEQLKNAFQTSIPHQQPAL